MSKSNYPYFNINWEYTLLIFHSVIFQATDTDLSAMSPKKEKKKKSGLRTPSFLKKKKKDKKKA